MTPWLKLSRFPPVLVRLLARDDHGKALSDDDIVVRSGLTLAEVKRLSYMTSWHDVRVRDTQKFLLGCNVDLFNRRSFENATRYRQRGSRFKHLINHPQWPEFQRMLSVLGDYLQKKHD